MRAYEKPSLPLPYIFRHGDKAMKETQASLSRTEGGERGSPFPGLHSREEHRTDTETAQTALKTVLTDSKGLGSAIYTDDMCILRSSTAYFVRAHANKNRTFLGMEWQVWEELGQVQWEWGRGAPTYGAPGCNWREHKPSRGKWTLPKKASSIFSL